MKPSVVGWIIGLGIVALLLGSSTYTLSENEQAVMTRFGEPRGSTVSSPGLHLKLPFADTVNRFDKRWLDWRGDPNQIPTKDKKYIWVDTFGRWRIVEPLRERRGSYCVLAARFMKKRFAPAGLPWLWMPHSAS